MTTSKVSGGVDDGSDAVESIDETLVDYTVVCDGCGEEWSSEWEWLENDDCMQE